MKKEALKELGASDIVVKLLMSTNEDDLKIGWELIKDNKLLRAYWNGWLSGIVSSEFDELLMKQWTSVDTYIYKENHDYLENLHRNS